MASNGEIEKLERRWLENPLGLTFASLAEAYRKTGDHAKGLEILDLGLAQHPNYVPAHIVRGRCHLDAGDLAQAELAFGRVIQLDPENPIALKSLAELAENEGRLPEAVGRLEALLEVDRNNEEARGQLDRVRELLSAPTPSVAAGTEPVEATGQIGPLPDLQRTGEGAPLSSSEEPFPDVVLQAELTEAGLPEPDAARGQEMIEEPDALAAQGLHEFEVKSASDVPLDTQPMTAEPSPAEFTEALDEPTAFDLEPTFEAEAFFQAESEPEALREAPPAFEFELEPARESSVPAAEPESDPEPEPAPESEPVATAESPAPEPEPELVVTETMAEIFLRQGHRELALAVYSQLAQRDPANTRAAEAATRLRAELEPPPAPEPPPPPAPEPQRFDSAATGGTSVAALFAALLKAERPASSSAIHPPAFESQRRNYGEPTRPADDSLSLSAVFGEEVPLTAPAGGPAEANPSEPSFEQFFSPAESAAEAELPKAPEDAPVMSSMAPEDLEQFNAWLRGLKR